MNRRKVVEIYMEIGRKFSVLLATRESINGTCGYDNRERGLLSSARLKFKKKSGIRIQGGGLIDWRKHRGGSWFTLD